MCELFGYYGKSQRDLTAELKEFYSHSPQHPDGWGIAVLDRDPFFVDRAPECANDSDRLADHLSQPIVSSMMLAHIRAATVGANEPLNCHPFCGDSADGRHWTLIHNGTIWDYPEMAKFAPVQKGTCDSERVLLRLLELMDAEYARKGEPLDAAERFRIFDDMVNDCAGSGKNKVNLLICDGELLYAHVNYAGTLHQRFTDDGVMFSTQPLSIGDWEPVSFMQPLAYECGDLRFEGTKHNGQYFTKAQRERMALVAAGIISE